MEYIDEEAHESPLLEELNIRAELTTKFSHL